MHSSVVLVLFGASGDLVYKKIYPALAAMTQRGEASFPITSVASYNWTINDVRDRVHDSLKHNGGVYVDTFTKLSARLKYGQGDYHDPETFKKLKQELGKAKHPPNSFIRVRVSFLATSSASVSRLIRLGLNRLSNTILAERLTRHGPDALIALYEHSVFIQVIIWDIDSFDQWGVELGKALAKRTAAEIASTSEPQLDHDSSTNALIRRYRRQRVFDARI